MSDSMVDIGITSARSPQTKLRAGLDEVRSVPLTRLRLPWVNLVKVDRDSCEARAHR